MLDNRESPNRNVLNIILLVGSLAAAGLGQLLLLRKDANLWQGVVLYLAAVAGFLALAGRLEHEGATSTVALRRPVIRIAGWRQWSRIGAVVVAIIFAVVALALIRQRPKTYWGTFAFWILAVVLYMGAFVRASFEVVWAEWREKLLRNRWEVVAVGATLLLAAVLRMTSLDSIPAVVGGDEGSQGLEALDVLSGEKTDMFGTGWLGVPNMSFFWQALWFKVLGSTVVTLRLPWAFVGVATVLFLYLLLRGWFGRGVALVGTFLLATYHYHIHFSRLGSNQVADPLFVVATVYFLQRGFRRGSAQSFAWAGFVLGTSTYFYAGARLTFVLVGAYLVLEFLFHPRDVSRHWTHLLITAGAALIVGGPMVQYAIRYPNDFNSRLNQVGIIQSGWLTREVQITHRTAVSLLLEQFRRAIGAFNAYADRTVWYGSPRPLMDAFWGVLFVLGMGLSFYRWKESRYRFFLLWFWLGIIIGGMLTESPPSSQRLITLAPPACFFVAVAVTQIAGLVGGLVEEKARVRYAVTGVAVAALAFLSVNWYFRVFTPMRLYGSINGEVATVAGRFLEELGPEYRTYFFGPPRMWYGFATIPYIAYGHEGIDMQQPIRDANFVRQDKGAVFMFLPERLNEMKIVRLKYPDGAIRDFSSGYQHQLLFTAYVVPIANLAQ